VIRVLFYKQDLQQYKNIYFYNHSLRQAFIETSAFFISKISDLYLNLFGAVAI